MPVLLTNEVKLLANIFENSFWFFLISASLKSIFYQQAFHFSLFWAEFCKTIRNCTFLWFQWGFTSSFCFVSSLQCFSLKLPGWWSHTDSINYWYLHSEMDHWLIQHSEWEGTHTLMPPVVLCFDAFCFVFLKILFYFGVAICFS